MSSTRRPFGSGPADRSPDAPDAAVVAFLRREYAAPTDDGYWAGLERRVMAGMRSAGAAAEPEWWQPFAGWVRIGLAAAGVAAVIAGAALLQSRDADGTAAYVAVLEPTAPTPAQAAASRDALGTLGTLGTLGGTLGGTRAGSLADPRAEGRIEQDVERARAREAAFRYVITH